MTAMPLAGPSAAVPWVVWRPSPDDVFLTLTGRVTGPDDGAAALAGATGKDAA
jgi:hypothetical protein